MFVHIGRCAPVKIDAFFRSVRLDSVLVHGLGLDRDFKGWMGEVWKREFAEWFFGPSGRVWGPFFFSNRESRHEDRNGGLRSSFRRTNGETREERLFGT